MMTNSVSNVLEPFADDPQMYALLKSELEKRDVITTLTAIRAARDVTQAEVARELGVQQSRISKLENGYDADVTLGAVEAYAKALGCDVTILLSRRGASLAEQVNYHAAGLRNAFLKLAELAQQDPEIAQGVAQLHVQAFANLNRFLQDASEKLPTPADPGEPHIRVAPRNWAANPATPPPAATAPETPSSARMPA